MRPVPPVPAGTRFAISYSPSLLPLFLLFFMGPRNSGVVVTGERLQVRMGAAFRADVAMSAVQSAGPDTGPIMGWGVHGWRGSWLVNGSSDGLVRIAFAPAARARMFGLPVRLAVLRVGVSDPDGLIAALPSQP